MRFALSKFLAVGMLTLCTSSAFAAKTVFKTTFDGFNANASNSGSVLCPTPDEMTYVNSSVSVNAFDSTSGSTGTPPSTGVGINIGLSLSLCDGSSYQGYFPLPGTGFVHPASGPVTMNTAFYADNSRPTGTDEYGNIIWTPTGTQAWIQISVTLTPNGDFFTGVSRNVQRAGNVTTKTKQDGKIYETDAVVSVKVDGVPFSFGSNTTFGDYSSGKNTTITITRQ